MECTVRLLADINLHSIIKTTLTMLFVLRLITAIWSVPLLVASVFLTFGPYPFALISFLGYFIVATAVGVVFGVWFNPDNSQVGLTRVGISIVGSLLTAVGLWAIDTGGFASFLFGGIKVNLSTLGFISGVCYGIQGMHRDDYRSQR